MKLPSRLTAALALIPAAALLLTSCASADGGGGSSADSSGLTTLTVATIGLTSDGALMTGIEQGFFEAEGLKIETSIVANPPAGLAAVQGGQVDIAYSPTIPLLNALSQGVDLKIVAPADGYEDFDPASFDPQTIDDTWLVASEKSGITSIDELAGKTVAVPARKAQLEVVISGLLEDAGIDPVSGVNWVVLDFNSAVAALKSGTVDAAGLVAPFSFEAVDAGNTYVASPSVEFLGGGAVGLWVAGASTIEKKPDAIAAFERAIIKSNEYSMANMDEAIQAGLDYTDSNLTVDEVTETFWPTEIRIADIERVNDKMAKLGFLDKPVDLSNAFFKG